MAKRIEDDPGDWVDIPTIGADTTDPGDWIDVPVDQEPQEPTFGQQMTGRVAKGFMTLGRAFTGVPETAVRQAGLLRQWSFAEDVLREKDPPKQADLRKKMSESKTVFDATAEAMGEAHDWQAQGAETIIRNHPEWKSNPPDSFIELLKDPRETALAITESIPLLFGAGIMTAAGQPNVATAMMFTAEGQNMKDQVLADGGTEEEAAIAYTVYGLPAAAMEKMQLDKFIKVAKGAYKVIFNRVVQKVAKGGLRTATYESMKLAASEAVEEVAQGAWGEITAKIVYDKDIPGGLWGFIDRRAQDAYLGYIVGLLPGAGGAVIGRIQGGKAAVKGEAAPVEPAEAEKPADAPAAEPTPKQPKRSVITDQAIKEAAAGILGETTELPITKDLDLEQTLTEPTPAPEPTPTPKPTPVTRKGALKLGHTLPDLLEWDEAKRRDFMQQTVGQTTMKGMKLADMRTLVDALQGEVRAAGLEYTPPTPPVEELVSTLEETKKVTELTTKQELKAGSIRQLGRKIKSGAYSFTTGLERMERFFESLDGHEAGPFTKHIGNEVKRADELSTEFSSQELDEFTGHVEDQGIDMTVWLGKSEDIAGYSFTPFQKVGVYALSQNKSGRQQLIKGVGVSESDLASIIAATTSQEKAMADWMIENLDMKWNVIKVAATQSGVDVAKLKKEDRYFPIMRKDADIETQEDFLSDIVEGFTGDRYDPEHKFLEERKKGAAGKIELDAAVIYMRSIARTNRFIQFAPVAHRVGRILNNKKFKKALNDRTYGQGSNLINKWMKDSVRGSLEHTGTWVSDSAAIMRRNAIIYAIGYNIPSSFRQTLSLSNAVAVDSAMLKHVPANIAIVTGTLHGYRDMQKFVYDRSLQVKHATFDRDIKVLGNKKGLHLKARKKLHWSQKSLRWIRYMDRHTRVVAWKSLYDTGIGKFNDETKAIEYADKWLGRTQPSATMKDLPHFFRGSEFEKTLTSFQNQTNHNSNFYVYDIIGARAAGKISNTETAHRVMFSYVLPAMLYGMIGRGGLPKDWKDVAIDLGTYPIAGLIVVGRWVTAAIRGWGGSQAIAGTAPGEATKLYRAVKHGNVRNIIKRTATTVGAATGRIPAQAIRTAEGVVDIAAGETKDPRRLIYSEQALKQGKKKKKKTKYGGGYIL